MRFSVIIPLYNKAPYVAKAIESVLAQSFTDYELVIMDDGSQDGSFEVALQCIDGHPNCHIYRQTNKGVSVARNNAVALSQGEYLCFLDADDWWDPAFLEEMSQLIEEFPDAGIYGTNYTIVNETRHKTRVASVGVDSGFEKGYINYCQVYAKTMYMPLTSITVSIPRAIFEEMQGFPKNIKLGEDFMLWIRIALNYKVAFLNKPLAFYNQDVDGANRGVGRLHQPQEHMLWNLGFLEEDERTNPDYKRLIDYLRASSLMPYFLSKLYHDDAVHELQKVNWDLQPTIVRRLYKTPLVWLKATNGIRKCVVRLKDKFSKGYIKNKR